MCVCVCVCVCVEREREADRQTDIENKEKILQCKKKNVIYLEGIKPEELVVGTWCNKKKSFTP